MIKNVLIVDNHNMVRNLLTKLLSENYKNINIKKIKKDDGWVTEIEEIKPDLIFYSKGKDELTPFWENYNFEDRQLILLLDADNEQLPDEWQSKNWVKAIIVKPFTYDKFLQTVDSFLPDRKDDIESTLPEFEAIDADLLEQFESKSSEMEQSKLLNLISEKINPSFEDVLEPVSHPSIDDQSFTTNKPQQADTNIDTATPFAEMGLGTTSLSSPKGEINDQTNIAKPSKQKSENIAEESVGDDTQYSHDSSSFNADYSVFDKIISNVSTDEDLLADDPITATDTNETEDFAKNSESEISDQINHKPESEDLKNTEDFTKNFEPEANEQNNHKPESEDLKNTEDDKTLKEHLLFDGIKTTQPSDKSKIKTDQLGKEKSNQPQPSALEIIGNKSDEQKISDDGSNFAKKASDINNLFDETFIKFDEIKIYDEKNNDAPAKESKNEEQSTEYDFFSAADEGSNDQLDNNQADDDITQANADKAKDAEQSTEYNFFSATDEGSADQLDNKQADDDIAQTDADKAKDAEQSTEYNFFSATDEGSADQLNNKQADDDIAQTDADKAKDAEQSTEYDFFSATDEGSADQLNNKQADDDIAQTDADKAKDAEQSTEYDFFSAADEGSADQLNNKQADDDIAQTDADKAKDAEQSTEYDFFSATDEGSNDQLNNKQADDSLEEELKIDKSYSDSPTEDKEDLDKFFQNAINKENTDEEYVDIDLSVNKKDIAQLTATFESDDKQDSTESVNKTTISDLPDEDGLDKPILTKPIAIKRLQSSFFKNLKNQPDDPDHLDISSQLEEIENHIKISEEHTRLSRELLKKIKY